MWNIIQIDLLKKATTRTQGGVNRCGQLKGEKTTHTIADELQWLIFSPLVPTRISMSEKE